MAGFGSGSTDNALLVLAEVNYRLLPRIALLWNLIAVTKSRKLGPVCGLR
jgi:hypothetical protein